MTVAALQATSNGYDPLLLFLAADHLIRDTAQFRQVIDAGRQPAEEGRLVTFGIVPTAPETGYGYIEASEPFSVSAEPAALTPTGLITSTKILMKRIHAWCSTTAISPTAPT